MDPNAALRQLRELFALPAADNLTDEEAADRFSAALDLFAGLDQWLTRGGYAPADWTNLLTHQCTHVDADGFPCVCHAPAGSSVCEAHR